ncbi:MAG: dihydroneopterin aldolase [Taibaiella sp.]|nr:dihydroneopterin aldolase [Taibaiella sp.]
MLTVSLHGIRIHAPHGMYPQENLLGNEFDTDVDVWVATTDAPWPFIDYTVINSIVSKAFSKKGQLLEAFVKDIHTALKLQVPAAEKIRVSVRKLRPPMGSDVRYAQVTYEG